MLRNTALHCAFLSHLPFSKLLSEMLARLVLLASLCSDKTNKKIQILYGAQSTIRLIPII